MVVLDMSPENEFAMRAGPASMTVNFSGSTKSLESRTEFVNESMFGRRIDKAGLNAVTRQSVGVLSLQARGGKSLGEVVIHVTSKVGRVV